MSYFFDSTCKSYGILFVSLWLNIIISGERNGNTFQYSCLGNPMDREAWKATVHGVSRVGHDLATKPPPVYLLKKNNNFLVYPCCSIWHCFIIFYGWVTFYCTQVPHLLYLCWGELDCLHVLAMVNSATMNTGVQVSFQIRVFIFSGYMPRDGIAGSYCSSIFTFFFFLKICCFEEYCMWRMNCKREKDW